ncbi:hypothetical protein [Colwellia psychrerythraea]|uniref:Lipoprotein n=1 Tax=Colwellia psychrerythraea TaxID=28229 RepID=A0A099KNI7_COLPS|nr:hypothetical protein [Colwellia psychrerythraea]KGJ91795.1 hypothetical protein GAB14E_2952 [Colwellia psychrerythraea]
MNKFLISPLLLTIFLQGCGGSSSSSPEVPVEPVEYNFSLTSQLTNDCGIPSAFTEVELLLQDNTWQTLKVYQPDENGVISFVTENEFINYTLVAKNQQGSKAQGLNIESFYQASSATPSHYQAQFDDRVDNDSCQCVTKNLELSHRSFETQSSVTSSLEFTSSSIIDKGTTLFEGVKVCGTLDGAWPFSSFSILGTDSNDKEIGAAGFTDDFNVNDDVWRLSVFDVANTFQLNQPYQDTSNSQLIKGVKHFLTQATKDEQSLLIFDTHNYVSEAYYQSQASVTFPLNDGLYKSAISKNIHQVISTNASDSLILLAGQYEPAFDYPDFDEIKPDYRYDYSAVTGYPMAIINFTFTDLTMPAKWTFYGPEKGLLAISAPLKGYEDIIKIDSEPKTIDVHLIKSKLTNNYQDYIKHYQGDSALNLTDDFVKDITAAELALKL